MFPLLILRGRWILLEIFNRFVDDFTTTELVAGRGKIPNGDSSLFSGVDSVPEAGMRQAIYLEPKYICITNDIIRRRRVFRP